MNREKERDVHSFIYSVMFTEKHSKFFILIIPVCIALAIYKIPFAGKQIVSFDAPLTTTFDFLTNHIWKLHPFIINVTQLEIINSTCTYYEIVDRIEFIPSIHYTTSYYVRMNIDRKNFCLTSQIQTSFSIMNAYHQYCIHENTLKPTTIIITDQFHGHSWLIFKGYIEKNMLASHKSTLEKLRKEMMIYGTD